VLQKLLLTVGLVAAVLVATALIRGVGRMARAGKSADRTLFWIAQATHLLALAGIIAVVAVVWLPSMGGMGAIGGWAAAGLTISLQRVVTAFSGYLIILRGNVFTVGDRIMLGGVRGDVIALGFMQTTVMEMGQTPAEQNDDPSMWIRARQYSGRIVRVTNDKIFDQPVYNYTRDFRYIWEELVIPVRFADDYRIVEGIMLEAGRKHTAQAVVESRDALRQVQDKYFLDEPPVVEPRVYMRITDNWTELSLRYITRMDDARAVKDAMSRDVLAAMNEAKIGVASGTYAIVEMPPLEVRTVS
jgi:small-conductance mechanosensitive channel